MIYNVFLTGQEKYNSLFSACRMLSDMKCVHPFTNALTSLRISDQKNLFLSQNRVLYSLICPALGPV